MFTGTNCTIASKSRENVRITPICIYLIIFELCRNRDSFGEQTPKVGYSQLIPGFGGNRISAFCEHASCLLQLTANIDSNPTWQNDDLFRRFTGENRIIELSYTLSQAMPNGIRPDDAARMLVAEN